MKPLQVDLPYPSLTGLGEDFYNARILNPAYADVHSELGAILQYIYHSFNFDHIGMDEYAAVLESISINEMHHFDLLGTALISMGVNPVFTANPPSKTNFYNTSRISYSTAPQTMILDDIAGEMKAIEEYECMLKKLTNETVATLIRRILLDEELHLKTLKELYEKLVGACALH